MAYLQHCLNISRWSGMWSVHHQQCGGGGVQVEAQQGQHHGTGGQGSAGQGAGV